MKQHKLKVEMSRLGSKVNLSRLRWRST